VKDYILGTSAAFAALIVGVTIGGLFLKFVTWWFLLIGLIDAR
jgi:hypothetical protein